MEIEGRWEEATLGGRWAVALAGADTGLSMLPGGVMMAADLSRASGGAGAAWVKFSSRGAIVSERSRRCHDGSGELCSWSPSISTKSMVSDLVLLSDLDLLNVGLTTAALRFLLGFWAG